MDTEREKQKESIEMPGLTYSDSVIPLSIVPVIRQVRILGILAKRWINTKQERYTNADAKNAAIILIALRR